MIFKANIFLFSHVLRKDLFLQIYISFSNIRTLLYFHMLFYCHQTNLCALVYFYESAIDLSLNQRQFYTIDNLKITII